MAATIKAVNRKTYPWLIVGLHRPIYADAFDMAPANSKLPGNIQNVAQVRTDEGHDGWMAVAHPHMWLVIDGCCGCG